MLVGAYSWYFYLQGEDAVEADGPPALFAYMGGMLNLGMKKRPVDEESLKGSPRDTSDKED